MIGKCPQQAVAAGQLQAVCVIAEFSKQVQNPRGYRPTKSKVAPYFCAGVIGDEESIGASWIRGLSAELIAPETQLTASEQFYCDQAYRIRVVAVFGYELEIDYPNVRKGQQIKRLFRYNRWLKAIGRRQGKCHPKWLTRSRKGRFVRGYYCGMRYRSVRRAGVAAGRIGRAATNQQFYISATRCSESPDIRGKFGIWNGLQYRPANTTCS